MKNEKREYLEKVLKDWRVFCEEHRLFEEAITEALKNLKEYEKMEKYIIVKRNAEERKTQFLARTREKYPIFVWTDDITEATIYNDYEFALLDWKCAVEWYNPKGERIFIPIYNDEFEGNIK